VGSVITGSAVRKFGVSNDNCPLAGGGSANNGGEVSNVAASNKIDRLKMLEKVSGVAVHGALLES